MQDELDRLIIQELQEDARISNAELARRVQLSPPATLARIRRLEESGLIQDYTTVIDRKLAGYDLLCFVSVSLQVHDTEQLYAFRSVIREIHRVLECHHVTGDYDYLLKVVACNTADLEDFLVNQLTPAPGVARIHTSVVLREIKPPSPLALP